ALRDTESALRFDECRDHIDHSLCLKARCLIGMEQYEQAEQLLCRINRMMMMMPQKVIPFLNKDLLLLRMKKLISCGYTIPLSRIYAQRYNMIADSLAAIEQNCQILLDKKLNESDPKLHLWLINQQQQNPSSSTTDLSLDFLNEAKCPTSKTMQYWSNESQRFYTINSNDYDDEEIYFSDEDEREQWYGHPDQWNRPKDILQQLPVHYEDAKDGSNSPLSKTASECYYFRTTGCDRQHCTFRHVLGNKGIDKQTWMRKKN
ncbi:hypothetical protein BLA29_006072, partial [Euroglyphus maynei]